MRRKSCCLLAFIPISIHLSSTVDIHIYRDLGIVPTAPGSSLVGCQPANA